MRESSNFGEVSETRLQCIKNEKERKKKGKLLLQEAQVGREGKLSRPTKKHLFYFRQNT